MQDRVVETPFAFTPVVISETVPDYNPPPPHARRRVNLTRVLVIWIAVMDLCISRTNFSVLYVAPLVLKAQSGQLHNWLRAAGKLVFLVYFVYIAKNLITPGESGSTIFDYRLVNRTMVALMILVMSRVLQTWSEWRKLQNDPDLPEVYLSREQSVGTLFAAIFSVPMLATLAVLDYWSPADYNIAILYPVPLLICGFTNSRKLLWSLLAVLLVMTFVLFEIGESASQPEHYYSLLRNRVLASLAMIVVTLVLHMWMGRGRRQRSRII